MCLKITWADYLIGILLGPFLRVAVSLGLGQSPSKWIPRKTSQIVVMEKIHE